MGDVSIIPNSIEQDVMPNSQIPIVHFKFQLEQPVIENLYNFITYNPTSNNHDEKIESIEKLNPHVEEIKHTIPLYDFYAAAGSFSELQSEKTYTYIEVPEKYSANDYFACEVIGESMNRRIPNGSICIFKKESGGSRNGKIVLVENRDIHDQDFNSGFTVKTYSSKKTITEEGWKHEEIVLIPNSNDAQFKDIIITEDNSEGMSIVGELICVLDQISNAQIKLPL
jgi:SOS-response transcriptional repressor LexA